MAAYEMPSQLSNGIPVTFPWPNTQALAEQLRNGDIALNTAISQFGAVMRENLKIIEDFSTEQAKLNSERKNQVDKMDKLIGDLTEKCQVMQQALLYKEEKYDEKCRETERYKAICELSAKGAISYDVHYDIDDKNQNNSMLDFREPRDMVFIKTENQQVESDSRSVKNHAKLSQSRLHLTNTIDALQPNSQSSRNSFDMGDSSTGRLAASYVGGPCKRKQNSREGGPSALEAKFYDRLASIGGINVKPPTTFGPVSMDRLSQQPTDNYYDEDQNKRVKIALACQSNEVMSSSKNAVYQTKQKFTERDLHKQVARGCFTRMPSRRKKEWPF